MKTKKGPRIKSSHVNPRKAYVILKLPTPKKRLFENGSYTDEGSRMDNDLVGIILGHLNKFPDVDVHDLSLFAMEAAHAAVLHMRLDRKGKT